MNPPIRLGDLLIKAGVVNDAQLNAALNEQRQWGGRLGAILVRMGALSEDLLVKALAHQLNIPRAAIGPTDPIVVPQQILDRIDRAGIRAVLNFAPVQLHASGDMTVKTVNMAMELEGLTFALTNHS